MLVGATSSPPGRSDVLHTPGTARPYDREAAAGGWAQRVGIALCPNTPTGSFHTTLPRLPSDAPLYDRHDPVVERRIGEHDDITEIISMLSIRREMSAGIHDPAHRPLQQLFGIRLDFFRIAVPRAKLLLKPHILCALRRCSAARSRSNSRSSRLMRSAISARCWSSRPRACSDAWRG